MVIATIAADTFVAALAVYGLIIPRLRLQVYRVSKQGKFHRAMQMNRIFSRFPGYGFSIEGLILVNNGRYAEARTFLRPLAFDQRGVPLFKSRYFRWYMITLVNDDSLKEAEPLLEEAVRLEPSNLGLKLTLVSCLLDQKKQPERAREIMEQVFRDVTQNSYRQNDLSDESPYREKYPSDVANRIARYAWALAACGRRPEAEIQIERAIKRLSDLDYWDIASVEYFLGRAWSALGDFEKARKAFQLSIDIVPEGGMAIASQKALAKIGKT